MRRADRLFQIIQHLHYDRSITARDLAEALQVSERTIYRDVQDLSLSGVPIEGEAGVGYRLLRGFHLPPLMFNDEELAALILGARMVQAWTDKSMARAAGLAMRKIEAVLPEHLKPELSRQDILVPDFNSAAPIAETLALLRSAIRQRHKVRYRYTREDGQSSQRTVQPLGLFYWGRVWTLVAWCELRQDFRHFRLDRIASAESLEGTFEPVPGRTLDDFLKTVCPND